MDETRHGNQDDQNTDSEPGDPDFRNPTTVAVWYGRRMIELLRTARREPALRRLRSLGASLDTWAKLYRLSVDTAELQDLRKELEELRAMIEQDRDRKSGPQGIAKP
jgi:hypothetical protein